MIGSHIPPKTAFFIGRGEVEKAMVDSHLNSTVGSTSAWERDRPGRHRSGQDARAPGSHSFRNATIGSTFVARRAGK